MTRIAATLLRILVAGVILRILTSRPVIDFLEELVVLFDQRVVRLDFERLFIRDARFFQVAFVFVRAREVVVRFRVLRVDLRGALPAVDGFTPEAALRDRDPEFDLFLGVRPRIGRYWRRRGPEEQENRQDAGTHGEVPQYTPTASRTEARKHAGVRRKPSAVEQAICHGIPTKNVCFGGNWHRAPSSGFTRCPLFRNTCDPFRQGSRSRTTSEADMNRRAIIAVEVGRAGAIEVVSCRPMKPLRSRLPSCPIFLAPA